MELEQIEARVKGLIAEEMNIPAEKILPSSHLVQDLGLDSFDIVSLISLFEAELGQALDETEFSRIVTFQDVVELFQQGLKKESTAL